MANQMSSSIGLGTVLLANKQHHTTLLFSESLYGHAGVSLVINENLQEKILLTGKTRRKTQICSLFPKVRMIQGDQQSSGDLLNHKLLLTSYNV